MEDEDRAGAGIDARLLRAVALPAVVFALGFVVVAGYLVVRHRLLAPDLYTEALTVNDAYDRVYTEVLADPALAELHERLLGELTPASVDPIQVRVLSTSALRWTVPPSALQQGVEAFVRVVLEYLRGDVARLDADADVSTVLARVDDAAVLRVRTELADAADQVATSAEDYTRAVFTFAEQLSAGRVPGAVPTAEGPGVDRQQILEAILAAVGDRLEPRDREQIEAAVLADDERDALVTAAAELVADHAGRVGRRLRADAEGGTRLDVVEALAERAGRPQEQIIAELNAVRDAARWARPPMAAGGLVLMALGAGGAAWAGRGSRSRVGFALGVCALTAGLAGWSAWGVVTAVVDPPLEAATSPGPDGWRLPRGLRSVLSDVESTLATELDRTVARLAGGPALAGAVLVAGSASTEVLRRRTPAQRLVLASAFGGVVVAVLALGAQRTESVTERACNGHPELCDRRYDEVVQAASHNAMSSPGVVQVWPQHDGDLRSQLDAGVRVLMVDTHHWTALVSQAQLSEGPEPPLPAGVAQQVLATLGRLREARPGVFLCHNHCALGALPLDTALRQVRSFLEDNPDEVVTLMIQDHVPALETAAVFEAVGLAPFLHTHEPGTGWATLGQLVDRGERLVVFGESHGPPPSWYHHAFTYMQDTPYRFRFPSEFSCAHHRGPRDATLFVMNHWVRRVAPDRAVAAAANRREVIVERARRCAEERGQLPDIIAVDFANIGDLVGAVDTLNGVS